MTTKSTTADREVENIRTVFTDVDTILIPTRMTKLEASKELKLQHDEEEKIVEKVRMFEGWAYNDALVATMRVSRKTFGWLNAKPQKGFFGEDILPQEIKIQTDINEWEDCFFGDFQVAPWDMAMVTVGATGRPAKAYIKVEGKRKFADRIDAFFNAVEQELKENSIYRSKCLLWQGGNGFSFIENKGTDEIILNENEQLVLDNFIIKPLVKGTEGKRGILFAGPYGTGKTETALKIGRIANANGHSFIYCKDRNLAEVLEVAKHYQPAVVFVEDIDELASGERSEVINDLLNTIDGIQTKGQQLTLIMTTNHKDKINQAFRRPGRIDVVLNFDLPTPATRAVMYEKFLKGAKLNYKKLAEATPEVQGAVVKEIANRALLQVEEGETLNDKHVLTSIELTRMQIEFMKEPATIQVQTIDSELKKMLQAVVMDPLKEMLD